jgi:hypothetical protein
MKSNREGACLCTHEYIETYIPNCGCGNVTPGGLETPEFDTGRPKYMSPRKVQSHNKSYNITKV